MLLLLLLLLLSLLLLLLLLLRHRELIGADDAYGGVVESGDCGLSLSKHNEEVFEQREGVEAEPAACC